MTGVVAYVCAVECAAVFVQTKRLISLLNPFMPNLALVDKFNMFVANLVM